MAEDGKSSPPLFGDDDEDVAQSPEPEESVPIDTDTQKEEKGLFDDDDDAENGETKRDDTPPEKEPETTQAPLSSVSDEPKVSAGDDDSTAEADEPAKDEDEDDLDDEYTIEVSVSDPQKVGDGMNAYMTYQVKTQTNMPQFKSHKLAVRRRFSDFLALHAKLAEKPAYLGRIIPPAPEKSVLGMTKVKFSKEESSGSTDFIGKRKAILQRFLTRLSKHPVLRKDEDFQEFLEKTDDLPKAKGTSALSGAGFMRLVKNVGDAVSKMTSKMEESDSWFEEKQQQLDALDGHLKKLITGIDSLVTHRRDLSSATEAFGKTAALLGTVEEHEPLARAMSQLAEIEGKIDSLHQEQASKDFFIFGELIREYIGLIGGIKICFNQRVKLFHAWQSAQATLLKKRESETKMKATGKTEKLPDLEREIKDWEDKVDKGQKEFDDISKRIKDEVTRFESTRVKEFKSSLINYLETLMLTQRQLISHWESFLPEAKAIV
ncbi:sorting nexin-2-like [Oscarella lobularis]|uniref:sorting nexin-2-like n=1 Tax=Oscarella lobularis TaxID=121494 RepID=UPI00331408DF